ncbi:MAG: hypothetical protein IH598_00905 [Bacteroidales bacterium]|nr:hypothetical protein [Bacteroidales bacterium]
MPLLCAIQPACTDYRIIINFPMPAPGLQNSRFTAPIVTVPPAGNALPMPGATEHNPLVAGEKVGSEAESVQVSQFGREDLWQKVTG